MAIERVQSIATEEAAKEVVMERMQSVATEEAAKYVVMDARMQKQPVALMDKVMMVRLTVVMQVAPKDMAMGCMPLLGIQVEVRMVSLLMVAEVAAKGIAMATVTMMAPTVPGC